MAEATNVNTGVLTFEFDGGEYELSRAAIQSMKVQRAMAYDGDPEHMREVWDAIDLIFLGKTSEYMDRLAGGNPLGCPPGRWGEFFQATMEAAAKT